ncbi:MAG: ATP-binding cassette domain-containing protein [Euryarchaeota archaeon]|nr:ATP-binding cassette domain-containing protein [Euryarchaeota archaeon]
MAVIEVEGLTKVYEKKIRAVDGVSFAIEEGEVFGLLGPNGAGKTTLLHMLATLLEPTGGTARVNGHDIRKEPAKVRASIGIVFQDPSSDDLLTGYENLMLHAMMFGVPRAEWKGRIRKALELVELTDRANDRVRKYSGGMRRRLELARGLLHKPRVLFLDEPTLGLDPQSRERVWEYIQKLVEEEGITVIITTHYMEEADHLCDRVAIIDFGRIAVMDSPAALKQEIGERILLKGVGGAYPDLDSMAFLQRVERDGDRVELWVDDASKRLKPILEAFPSFEKVEIRPPTLNDVFLKYTGREIREGSAEGGFFERALARRARR